MPHSLQNFILLGGRFFGGRLCPKYDGSEYCGLMSIFSFFRRVFAKCFNAIIIFFFAVVSGAFRLSAFSGVFWNILLLLW